MRKLLGLMILGIGQFAFAQNLGVLTRTPINEYSVGCGIVEGRLLYQSKTHDEIDWAMLKTKGPQKLKLLEALSSRYADLFHEDQGYNIEVRWNVEGKNLNRNKVKMSFAGMVWETTDAQMPEKVEIFQSGNELVLKFAIDSLNYCLSDEDLKLSFGNQENPDAGDFEFIAHWNSELTL